MAAQRKTVEGYVLLLCDDARLVLDPEHGGAIREYSCLGRHVLRPAPASAEADSFELSCFPLVPYANRIANGRFVSGHQQVQLMPNARGQAHPLHGQGWRGVWQVVEASRTEARLRFEGGGNDWPWRYRAEQHFRLGAHTLTMELSVENLASTPMPAMLGFHPYFADAAHARLHAHLPRVWRMDESSLPVDEIATPKEWSFDPERPIDAVALDHCFAGWDGRATLRWSDRIVKLQAAHCAFLHVYTPAGRDFFCVEPQSAAVGAITRGGKEAALVEHGRQRNIHFSLDVGAA
ncbi:MAG TPA: aldose 1-epimerase [Steroidobacteraceae bacterium]|nr:aldose 1-epimerase [Steroidobacteraceae bacterium]